MASSIASPPNNRHSQRRNMRNNNQNTQLDMNKAPQPSTPPRTPRRIDHFQHTQNRAVLSADEGGSKQKSRHRNQQRNAATSPAATKSDRNTPPIKGAQAATRAAHGKAIPTPSAAAFAGATFHASPAASALPIPSFYSKSVPDSPLGIISKPAKDGSSSDSSDPSSPPSRPLMNNRYEGEESPLDFFFKADREEKARVRSASSNHGVDVSGNPFAPPSEPIPNNYISPPSSRASRVHKGHFSRNSASSMFAMELDSPRNNGSPLGPAFSTPYSQRINAVRSANIGIQPAPSPSKGPQQPVDNAEALKAYLFSGVPSPSPTTLPSNHNMPSLAPAMSPLHNTIAPNTENPGAAMHQRFQNINVTRVSEEKTSDISVGNSTRKSGLRKELNITPTRTSNATQDYSSTYLNSPTPSRMYSNNVSDSNSLSPQFYSHSSSPFHIPTNRATARSTHADLQGMEESLRKLLKLEPARHTISSGPGMSSLSDTTATLPNYAAGRAPTYQ
ncbi:hypothetical protein F5884DRAFT_850803 [Xylogone sp. PMI_703]|nr:hypothetical protein F5884DRAFT_850803 [Xylogone sp. PMI_703]